MTLYDIHTHKSSDIEIEGYEVIDFLNTYPNDFAAVKRGNPKAYFSCGIHPWHVDEASTQLAMLDEIMTDERVIAVGEIGLDKLHGPDLETQIKALEQQIKRSKDCLKPVIIHCVKYWNQLVALYNKHTPRQAWIIHGFRGNAEQARQLTSQGFYFSVGKYFNDEALKHIPAERLFCETDTSDIHVLDVYQKVASALDISEIELVAIVESNIKRVFFGKSSDNDLTL